MNSETILEICKLYDNKEVTLKNVLEILGDKYGDNIEFKRLLVKKFQNYGVPDKEELVASINFKIHSMNLIDLYTIHLEKLIFEFTKLSLLSMRKEDVEYVLKSNGIDEETVKDIIKEAKE
jgi:hypothetical protein